MAVFQDETRKVSRPRRSDAYVQSSKVRGSPTTRQEHHQGPITSQMQWRLIEEEA